MKLIVSLSMLLASFMSAAVENEQAFSSLEQLSKSLRTRNFSTSFVIIKKNNAEPYHWSHGINENNDELEILSVLNGPHRDIVRKNNTVSYLELGVNPYSIKSSYIASPIPEIFSGDTNRLIENYDLVSLGKSRVLGRAAQGIRIVSKDPHRYEHWLWLDIDSSLLLKLAIVNAQGQVVEQIQFTHLEFEEKISPSLTQLETTDLPSVIEMPESFNSQNHPWELSWLPEGFVETNANTHRIIHTKQPAEFKMFSDGLIDISVYVSLSEDGNRASGYAQDGATVAFNEVVNGLEVSVVGKIPVLTAKKIADAVVFKAVK